MKTSFFRTIMFISLTIMSSSLWAQEASSKQKREKEFVVGASYGIFGDMGAYGTCNFKPKKGKIGLFVDANIRMLDSYNSQKTVSVGVGGGARVGKHFSAGLNLHTEKGYSAPLLGLKLAGEIRLLKKKNLSISPEFQLDRPLQGKGISWISAPNATLKVGYVLDKKEKKSKTQNKKELF